jgi:hypothetical protein
LRALRSWRTTALAVLAVPVAVLAVLTPARAEPAPTPAKDTSAAQAAPAWRTPAHDEAIGKTTALSTTTNGQWTPVTNATITLTRPGAYEVVQQVRGQIVIPRDAVTHAGIVSRLFNVTTGQPVPESSLLVTTGGTRTFPGDPAFYGTTATGHSFIQVSRPTTIRLEAELIWNIGTPTEGLVITDANGVTKLTYKELA